MRNTIAAAILAAAVCLPVHAQQPVAARDTVATVVVGAEQTAQVTIAYERPLILGRQILGGVVPFGVPWRLGTDTPPELRTFTSLQIGNLWIPAGTYRLWVLATPTDATLIVCRQRPFGGTVYDSISEVGRVKLTADTATSPRDQFTIRLNRVRVGPDEIGSTMNKAGTHETIYIRSGVLVSLWIGWDRFTWTVPLTAPDTLRHRP